VSQQRNFWMRWRVRVGYPLAVIYWILATPTLRAILAGGGIAALGLIIRGAASGYLRKYEQLTTHGPYACTRNPLYLGSAFLALGFIVAGHSWAGGAIIALYFGVFYYAVMRNEERDLQARYGRAFEEYAARVPLFFPRLTIGKRMAGRPETFFFWLQYRRNREYQALMGTLAGLALLWLRMWLRMRFGY